MTFSGGPIGAGLAKFYGPLYFTVRQAVEVMSTEQPCDITFNFGDGLLNLNDFPDGFPQPGNFISAIFLTFKQYR